MSVQRPSLHARLTPIGGALRARFPAISAGGSLGRIGMKVGANLTWLDTSRQPFANLLYSAKDWRPLTGNSLSYTTDQYGVHGASATDLFHLQLTGLPTVGDMPPGTNTYQVYNPGGAIIGFGRDQDNAPSGSIVCTRPDGSTFTGWCASTDTEFTFTWTSGSMQLDVLLKGNIDTSKGKLVVLLPGHNASWAAGNIWRDQFLTFLSVLKPKTLRFMDMMSTSLNKEQEWADRSKPDGLTFWTPYCADGSLYFGAYATLPYEYAIDLCKRVGADPWICLPSRASSDYLDKFAALINGIMPVGMRLWNQRGNETWNFAYPWLEGYTWMTWWANTKYVATITDAANGIFTLAGHGMAEGASIKAWETTASLVAGKGLLGSTPYNFRCGGQTLTVHPLTANTFQVYSNGVLQTGFPAAFVSVQFAKMSDNAPNQGDLNANVGKAVLDQFTRFSNIIGRGRLVNLIDSQGAVVSAGPPPTAAVTAARVASFGAANSALADYVCVAPYFGGTFWMGVVNVTTTGVRGATWVGNKGNSGRKAFVQIYATGSTPRADQIVSGANAAGSNGAVSAAWSYDSKNYYVPSVSTPGGTNVGNGTLTGLAGTTNTVSETFTVTFTSATAFSVTGSVSGALAAGTVGTPYVDDRVLFTISAGTTPFAANDKFTIATANVSTGATAVQTPFAALTAGTQYDAKFVLQDGANGITYMMTQTFTAGTAQSINVFDTFDNQAFRDRRDIDSEMVLTYTAHYNSANLSGAPTQIDVVCYEGGYDFNYPMPAAMDSWVRMSYFLSAQSGQNVTYNFNSAAAAGFKDFNWYAADLNTVYGLAQQDIGYYDTTSPNIVAFGAFDGYAKRKAPVVVSDVVANAIPAAPGSLPYVVAALPAGLTYSVINGDPRGNYVVSGTNLVMTGTSGIDFNAPTAVSLRVLATDGNTSASFNVTFSTGLAWYEADASWVWDPATDTDTAQIDPIIGTVATRVAGTGATIVAAPGSTNGPLWAMGGTNAYMNSQAATLDTSKCIFIAVTVDTNNQSTNGNGFSIGAASAWINFGKGNTQATTRWSIGFNIGGVNQNPAFNTVDSFPAGGSLHVHWLLYDGTQRKVWFGVDLTQKAVGATAASPASLTAFTGDIVAPNIHVGCGNDTTTPSSSMKDGKIQLVKRTGIVLGDASTANSALWMVNKMMKAQNIAGFV